MKRDKQVLRDKTNIIVDNLLPENKAYFDEIRDYMILKSFLKMKRFWNRFIVWSVISKWLRLMV